MRADRRHYLLLTAFNSVGTHVPSHRLRQAWLRVLGARIGRGCSVLRGTTVLGPESLVLGDRCAIGWRCVLDARGGITLGHDVVVASDAQLLTADHDPGSTTFSVRLAPIRLEDHSWVATGALVLPGVTVAEGAVVAAGSVVHAEVGPGTIVAGSPARPIGQRAPNLEYQVEFRPPLW